jgi:hypothetical protein
MRCRSAFCGRSAHVATRNDLLERGAGVNQAMDAIETLTTALAETSAALDADERALAMRLDSFVETVRRPSTPESARGA